MTMYEVPSTATCGKRLNWIKAPVVLTDDNWEEVVVPIREWLETLSEDDVSLLEDWGFGRVSDLALSDIVAEVEDQLELLWKLRASVAWKELRDVILTRCYTAVAIETALKGALIARFAPRNVSRSVRDVLTCTFNEMVELTDAIQESPAVAEFIYSLGPTWVGSGEELLVAANETLAGGRGAAKLSR